MEMIELHFQDLFSRRVCINGKNRSWSRTSEVTSGVRWSVAPSDRVEKHSARGNEQSPLNSSKVKFTSSGLESSSLWNLFVSTSNKLTGALTASWPLPAEIKPSASGS
ncbi:unnamed protein product [Pleuronectes platessa]|uniref:Uncharacterized protein n=1 Tax=Pleuronectes platessa TaxID=8262 RepID=A0A9N7YML9_PLEPL|nr:unnamed protein product [Pleuronectes platessa]